MKIIKLILLAFPVVTASILLIASPAVASSIQSAPVTPHFTLSATQPAHQLIASKFSSDSKSIMDQLGCNCATCVKAKLQMEGKLTLTSFLY
ncbi:hypothetical protein ACF3DV_32515 [Chlorogloeopsis fritschii PCC 9212]|uniref:hypothetical protein n=1 Tax=Chlorogloeopsis fritschii TaxID=1124 RepID=UPI00036F2CB9|nr:hypothetical protein [Chlorogloeopsis fritschii]MBF2005527.1 hypothetical protein [Chlorogloeopsis fritschii C42_A2020_084]